MPKKFLKIKLMILIIFLIFGIFIFEIPKFIEASPSDNVSGFAWSDTDVGWVSFNCLNQGACATSNYKVIAQLDNTPPGPPTRDPTSRDWANTDVSVTVTYTDDLSGIAYTRHCWTTGASCDPGTTDESTFTNGGTVTKSETGQWTLCTRARDGAGNWSSIHCSAQGAYKVDKQEPNSQIQSPAPNTWYSNDFNLDTLDEDLESGLDATQCRYKVISYEPDGTEHSTGWLTRTCNTPAQSITVGEGISYTYKVHVTDNLKVTGCSLYIDGINQGVMVPTVQGCDTDCTFTKDFTFTGAGTYHNNYARCKDAAQNTKAGTSVDIVVAENHWPEITVGPSYTTSPCTQPTTQPSCNVNFTVTATDEDGDTLTYFWNFGDGGTSTLENPSHAFANPASYSVTLEVTDGSGLGPCSISQNVSITLPLPEWQEISPF